MESETKDDDRTSSGDGQEADGGRHEADAKLALGGAVAEVHGKLLAGLGGRSEAPEDAALRWRTCSSLVRRTAL